MKVSYPLYSRSCEMGKLYGWPPVGVLQSYRRLDLCDGPTVLIIIPVYVSLDIWVEATHYNMSLCVEQR